jgi:hypothetical protein
MLAICLRKSWAPPGNDVTITPAAVVEREHRQMDDLTLRLMNRLRRTSLPDGSVA